MATPVNDDFIIFLTVGKTGEGKSSTGNSILGRQVFRATAGANSTTKECQSEVAKVQGHNVVVVDSPGLADTDTETDGGLERLADEVKSILATQPDGFDAVLIIVRFGRRLTEEDKTVFKELEAFFGEDYAKNYGILVVTCVDSYRPAENGNMPIGEFLKKQKGLFAQIREKCNNRVVCFDNKTKDESVCQAQVKRLLDMVAALRKSSDRYTPRIFLEAQKSRDEVCVKAKKPFIKEKTDRSLKIIVQKIQAITTNPGDLKKLEDIKGRLKKQLEELHEQDKGSNVLAELISSVSKLDKAVTARIIAINDDADLMKTSEEITRQSGSVDKQLNIVVADRVKTLRADIGKVLDNKFFSKALGFLRKGVQKYNFGGKN